MATPIIDARVHVGRTQSTYPQAQRALQHAGIDTALLCAQPESPQLSDDVAFPLDLARPEGPYACYYVGGNPFGGYRRGEIRIPHNFDRYSALYVHCFLSASHDFGGAVTSAEWDPDSLRQAVEREDLAQLLRRAAEVGMPTWLCEHFPITLSLIERFPDNVFVIPRMGQMNGGAATVINALHANNNVCFDTAGGEVHEAVVKRLGYERVLFASGYPYDEPRRCLDMVSALDLADEQIEAIMGGNLLRLIQR